MPTVNWEVRKQSPHYRLYSLERFFLAKKIRCLRYMLLIHQNAAGSTDNSEFINILAVSMMIMSFQNDLFRLRPSNFYPPEGFYLNGSFDPFWSRDEQGLEMFLMRLNCHQVHFFPLLSLPPSSNGFFHAIC